jgi:hypothetical protein
MQADFAIEKGAKVADVITGFEGIVTGRVDYITGCNQYLVQPKQKADGNFIEAKWFDEHRLTVNEYDTPVTLPKAKRDGADVSAPNK